MRDPPHPSAGQGRRLTELGPLRDGATPERTRDAIRTLDGVEVRGLLTGRRGWSGEEYAGWVGRAMVDAVLP